MNKHLQKQPFGTVGKSTAIDRRQAEKIDILCNDMVAAHAEFVKTLVVLNSTVSFYEQLLGCNALTGILDITAAYIKEHVPGGTVAIFLLKDEGFKVHIVDDAGPIQIDSAGIESFFTEEMVDGISRSCRVCSLEDMFEMGLEDKAGLAADISAAAVPIRYGSSHHGFILVYRSRDSKLTAAELEPVVSVVPGLCRAFDFACSCHTHNPA